VSGDRQRAQLGALVVTPAQVNLSGGQPVLGGLPGEERLALQLARTCTCVGEFARRLNITVCVRGWRSIDYGMPGMPSGITDPNEHAAHKG
jgi:hypothetical protein